MRFKLMKQVRNISNPDATNQVIGRFTNLNDALWAATIFASHKIFAMTYIFWVEDGKKSYSPSSAINPESFNLIDREG